MATTTCAPKCGRGLAAKPRATRAAVQANSLRHPLRSRTSLHAVGPDLNNALDPTTLVPPAVSPKPDKPLPPPVARKVLPYNKHKWLWRGHTINYVTAGCGPPVLLVHGFGASVGHWRKTIPFLAQNYKVYAIDLLGFGDSAKPNIPYSMDIWQDQINDFIAEYIQEPAVLVGNSMGSLACLMAGAAAAQQPQPLVKGAVLLNCAGAMNNKGVVNDWRVVLAYPIFLLIDLLLSMAPVARTLFNNFRSPDNVRQVLSQVYVDHDSVDDELVDLIYKPSCDAGALEVFVSVITGPPGPKPWDCISSMNAPLLVMWGDKDPFTPLDGPVGKYMMKLPKSRSNTEFQLLQGVGHCPQDDKPDLMHDRLLAWLRKHHSTENITNTMSAAEGAAA